MSNFPTGTPFITQLSDGAGLELSAGTDQYLRNTFLSTDYQGTYFLPYSREYDTANNVTKLVSVAQVRSENDPTTWEAQPTVHQVMTYGPHGNLLTSGFYGFPNSTVTTTYYNASKYFQKASVQDANGRMTQFDYFDNADPSPGNRGEVRWVRDARYATTGKQFEYAYNSYGQKTQEKNLNDVYTNYTYGDQWGNLTQVVQDPGTGRLNRTTLMSYDAAGRVVQFTDPMSRTSSFAFNGVGQPTAATLPGETVSYAYGANGRTESVTDGRGATSIAYEAGNDRVASVTDPVTGTVGYTYGPAGERATMTLPGGGTWSYEYLGGPGAIADPCWPKTTRTASRGCSPPWWTTRAEEWSTGWTTWAGCAERASTRPSTGPAPWSPVPRRSTRWNPSAGATAVGTWRRSRTRGTGRTRWASGRPGCWSRTTTPRTMPGTA